MERDGILIDDHTLGLTRLRHTTQKIESVDTNSGKEKFLERLAQGMGYRDE